MNRQFFFAIVSFGLLFTCLAGAQDISKSQAADLMDDASVAYQEGRFDEALRTYTQVFEAGYVSAILYYNVGNCHFKLNAIPKAILWYERAAQLEPSDEDIRFNLELARSRIVDRIEQVPELFFVGWWNQLRDLYGQDGWALVGLFSFGIFIFLLLIFLLSAQPLLKRITIWPGLIALLIAAHALAFAWQKHQLEIKRPFAIIFTPAVTVKSSPDPLSIDLFVIHEGTKVQVMDQLGEWLEVKIPSGERGWLTENSLERI